MFGMRKNGRFSSQQEDPTEQIKIIGYTAEDKASKGF